MTGFVSLSRSLAVREAIGQLFAYRHFLYRACRRSDPILLALFSEPIGDAFVALLSDLGIAVAWLRGGAWIGSTELCGLLDIASLVSPPKGLLTLGFDPTRFQTEPPACYRAS
jgi:hypothetical protein